LEELSSKLSVLFLADDVHSALYALLELNYTWTHREQCIVVTATNQNTWVDTGTALADKNLASVYELAVETLNAKTF
jgi:hypothetical protein